MTARFAWPQFRVPWSVALMSTSESVSATAIDAGARRIRLDDIGAWTSTTFAIETSTTETTPLGVGELEAFALVSSKRSNTRIPVRLDSTGPNHFHGELTLDRDTLAGAVDIIVQVVAADPVRMVGEGEPWTVTVDASAAPPRPGAPPFATEWVDFTSADAPQSVRDSQASYAVMDLSGPDPVLRLNSSIKGFEALLGSTSAKLERRRMRDVLATGIAKYAVGVLFREAMARLDIDDAGEVTLPDDPLLMQVLDSVASESRQFAAADDFYRRLATVNALTSVDRARLWAEVDTTLDRLTNHAEQTARAIEEIRHV
jgi:hypothetical protein